MTAIILKKLHKPQNVQNFTYSFIKQTGIILKLIYPIFPKFTTFTLKLNSK